jgi:hypothetical protein
VGHDEVAQQTDSKQVAWSQSPVPLQLFPLAQCGQVAPPQSTSVSVPFCVPSEQGLLPPEPVVAPELCAVEPVVAPELCAVEPVVAPELCAVEPVVAPELCAVELCVVELCALVDALVAPPAPPVPGQLRSSAQSDALW